MGTKNRTGTVQEPCGSAKRHARDGREPAFEQAGGTGQGDLQTLQEETFQEIREGHIVTGEEIKTASLHGSGTRKPCHPSEALSVRELMDAVVVGLDSEKRQVLFTFEDSSALADPG